jgi:hypothetical protein
MPRWVSLVDSAELLTATKPTRHLVFDPRCLCGDKPLACLYRTEGMILFQPRDIDHRLVKALRKFCINSTRMYPKQSGYSRSRYKPAFGHLSGRLPSACAGVVALKQVDRFWGKLISYFEQKPDGATCRGVP